MSSTKTALEHGQLLNVHQVIKQHQRKVKSGINNPHLWTGGCSLHLDHHVTVGQNIWTDPVRGRLELMWKLNQLTVWGSKVDWNGTEFLQLH